VNVTPLTYEILVALADEDHHGYGIIKEIEGCGGSVPSTGAMYLALRRMQAEGLIRDVPTPVDSDARRRYYRITDEGRSAAKRQSERLAKLLASARSKKLLEEDAA